MSRSICVASFVAVWLVTLLCAVALLTLVILCAVSCWAVLTRRQLSYIFASSKIVRVEQKPTVILRSSEMFLTVSLLNEQKAIKRSVVKFDRSILFYLECKIFWRFGGKGQQKGYPFHFHHLRKVCNSYWRFVWLFRQPWLKGTAKFWPTCSRVDDRYGDQHLVCSCPPLESYDYEKTKSFA